MPMTEITASLLRRTDLERFSQVSPCREILISAAENKRGDILAVFHVMTDRNDLVHHLLADGIPALWTIQFDDQCWTFLASLDCLIAHYVSSKMELLNFSIHGVARFVLEPMPSIGNCGQQCR